jgi:hypothetical protein
MDEGRMEEDFPVPLVASRKQHHRMERTKVMKILDQE